MPLLILIRVSSFFEIFLLIRQESDGWIETKISPAQSNKSGTGSYFSLTVKELSHAIFQNKLKYSAGSSSKLFIAINWWRNFNNIFPQEGIKEFPHLLNAVKFLLMNSIWIFWFYLEASSFTRSTSYETYESKRSTKRSAPLSSRSEHRKVVLIN